MPLADRGQTAMCTRFFQPLLRTAKECVPSHIAANVAFWTSKHRTALCRKLGNQIFTYSRTEAVTEVALDGVMKSGGVLIETTVSPTFNG